MKYFKLETIKGTTLKVHLIKHSETPSEELLKEYIAEDEEVHRLTEVDNPEQWFKTLNV